MDTQWLLSTVVLPACIAAIGAFTTVSVTIAQIRARDRERRRDQWERGMEREHAVALRREENLLSDRKTRAEVLESIDTAMNDYRQIAELAPSRLPSLFALRAAFNKLSTRCDVGHLSLDCIQYVEDAARVPHPERLLEAFEDIQRRLGGWHIGHMDVDQVQLWIHKGHDLIRVELEQHGIAPTERLFT